MAAFAQRHGVVCCTLWFVVIQASAIDYLSDLCGGTIYAGSSGGLVDSQRNLNYNNSLDCRVIISANASYRILLIFLKMDIVGDGQDCKEADYLQVYDGSSVVSTLGSPICGTKTPADIASKSSSVSLVFLTDSSEVSRGFMVRYTPFADTLRGSCKAGEFQCANDRCIDSSLKFNEDDNRGDNSDEREQAENSRNTKWNTETIVMCVIGVTVLVGIGLGIRFKEQLKKCPLVRNINSRLAVCGCNMASTDDRANDPDGNRDGAGD